MISVAIDGPVATLTMARPPVNAINEEWIDRFNQLLNEVEAAGSVTVIRIRSSVRTFCAGADLALMSERFETAPGRELMATFVRRLQALYTRIETMPAISIAEIGGAAVGGGLELALACDFRIVAQTAKVGLPEARLGLLPGAGGTQRLTRLCGDAISRRLILGAEVLTGEDAVQLGVAQWAVPADDLASFTDDMVAQLAPLPRAAVAECKSCIEAALDPQTDGFGLEVEGTHRLLGHPETQAKVKEFLGRLT